MMIFSSILSTLSAKTMQYNLRRQESANKIRTLERFLGNNKVRTSTAIAVHKQVKQRMQQPCNLLISDLPVLNLLSDKMRRMLHYEIYRNSIDLPLLRWWEAVDEDGVQDMCHQAMESLALASGDTLFHQS